MKVFISWSGDYSKEVANVFRDWLPQVIQSLEPYVSSEDIEKGARWSTDISKELEETYYGILCVTHENLFAPWLYFEAGALSKAIDKSRVAPFLLGVKKSEIPEPLIQFQVTIYDEKDARRLLKDLNNACGENKLGETRFNDAFDVWWPRLQKSLNPIAEAIEKAKKKTTTTVKTAPEDLTTGILEELLELGRSQQKILSNPERLLPPDYLSEAIGGRGLDSIHPEAIRDLRHIWERIEELISDLESVEPERKAGLIDEIANNIRDLGKPISYIIRKYTMFRRRVKRYSDESLFGE